MPKENVRGKRTSDEGQGTEEYQCWFMKWEGGEACDISEKDPTNMGKATGQSGETSRKETGNLKKER